MCALRINSVCTLCGDCLPVCPTHSIFVGIQNYVIDSDTCEECRICAPICPVDAIHGGVKEKEEEEESEA